MNTPIQICIIDDEQDGRDYITHLLKNEFPDFQIVFQAANVKEAYLKLTKDTPDIIFLDIQLTDGTAFDLLSKFKQLSSQIIFVTAFEHFAIQAIKNGATDYLLKPIDELDFVIAVNKAVENIKKNSNQSSLHDSNESKINLPTLHGFKRINIDDIIRCEADASYTSVYLADKSMLVVSKQLKEFEGQLFQHNFMRIHHKHLINLKHFKEYIKGKGGQAVMTDNTVIDVSVRKKSDFLQKIKYRT